MMNRWCFAALLGAGLASGAGCNRARAIVSSVRRDPFAGAAEDLAVRAGRVHIPTVTRARTVALPPAVRVMITPTELSLDNAEELASWPDPRRRQAIASVGVAEPEAYPMDRRALVPLREGALPPEALVGGAASFAIRALTESARQVAGLQDAFRSIGAGTDPPAESTERRMAALFIDEAIPAGTVYRVVYSLGQAGFDGVRFAARGSGGALRAVEHVLPRAGDSSDVASEGLAAVEQLAAGAGLPGAQANEPTFSSAGRVTPTIVVRRDGVTVRWGPGVLAGDCARMTGAGGRPTLPRQGPVDEGALRGCLLRALEAARGAGVDPPERVTVSVADGVPFGDLLRAMTAAIAAEGSPEPSLRVMLGVL
jgi:hypothetical protein